MTVIRYWTVRAHPGRFEDGVELLREGAKLIERHGGGDLRLSRGVIAGPNSDSLVLSSEFRDHGAFGAFVDEFGSDAEYGVYVDRLRAADAPFVLLSSALGSEVDLVRPDARRVAGSVFDAFVTRPLPGRIDDANRLTRHAFELFEGFGATRCRLIQLGSGGEHAGSYASIIEFESMATWGRARDELFSHQDGSALINNMNSVGAPSQIVSHSVYTTIQL